MKRKIWKWIRCYVLFECSGGITSGFLNDCAEKGLLVQHVNASKTGFSAETSSADYIKMHKPARKFRCRLHVVNKCGWRYTYKNYLRRIGIPTGLAVFCIVLFAFPSLLWSIKFYNFTPEQETQLRESLYEKGVYEGCFITHEKLERIETQIFAENDNYANLSLNLFDGRITAEKRDASKAETFRSKEISNLVAVCDGIVREWNVTNGFVNVKINQSVAKGQILVSGVGFGHTGKPYYIPSSGKVIAETELIYEAEQTFSVDVSLPTSNCYNSYHIDGAGLSFEINKKDAGENTSRNVSRYQMSLFGFLLPFTVTQTQTREYMPCIVTYTQKQAADIARQKIYDKLYADFSDAVIIAQSETIENSKSSVRVSIKFTFTADIAKTVPFGST